MNPQEKAPVLYDHSDTTLHVDFFDILQAFTCGYHASCERLCSRLPLPCKACKEKPATMLMIRCGHVNWCSDCAPRIPSCCCSCGSEPLPAELVGKEPHLCDLARRMDERGLPSRCNVCLERPSDVVILPCKHLSSCRFCLPPRARGCPACGTPISKQASVQWPHEVFWEVTSAIEVKSPRADGVALPGAQSLPVEAAAWKPGGVAFAGGMRFPVATQAKASHTMMAPSPAVAKSGGGESRTPPASPRARTKLLYQMPPTTSEEGHPSDAANPTASQLPPASQQLQPYAVDKTKGTPSSGSGAAEVRGGVVESL
eukprot:TRINITY_DN66981_c0_g1_i1.p1 TRINITY_DN66981_c0_g1~~TRINITY_DN66981_c0_g1_i1.p1  ORF type:complete len:314 (-),score=44.42 TRINITY_DN66981_c0_g1_i1:231-1172(-)